MQQDGETENVEINTVNEEVIDRQTGEKVLVNDLSVGKYDVITETGPAFATQRQESAQQLIDLTTGSPQFEALAMDLIAKDLPILESRELAKRVRKLMIGQGIVEPTQEEIEDLGLNQPQQPDPQQQAITENIQIQTEKMISDIETQEAKAEQGFIKLENEMNKQADEFALKLTELENMLGRQLDGEVKQNRLVFDPQIGDFVQGDQQ